jgi:putative membrane protein
MRKLAILCGGAALLAACQSTPPPPPPPPPPAAVDLSNPLLAPGYVAQAASSDQFEIQSSQLALQASQNPAVQNFANMMIADHTRSSQMVAAAAQSAGVPVPPPTLLPAQQSALDQLRSSGTGPSFDMAYKNAQISAHQQALTLHQNYATQGDVTALRNVAAQIVPIVQSHLQAAEALNVAPPPPPPAPPPRRAGERG